MYNVVVVVNGGKNVIPRKLLDELANAAGADTWECVDLPAESRPTKRAADGQYLCARCGHAESDHPVRGCVAFARR